MSRKEVGDKTGSSPNGTSIALPLFYFSFAARWKTHSWLRRAPEDDKKELNIQCDLANFFFLPSKGEREIFYFFRQVTSGPPPLKVTYILLRIYCSIVVHSSALLLFFPRSDRRSDLSTYAADNVCDPLPRTHTLAQSLSLFLFLR